MPLVAAALTFGSFGDILEAAKIAKRIIDVLRKGGGSHERQKLISTLQHICDDMSMLTLLPEDHFTPRLYNEVVLCRSLLEQFHTKIKSYEGFFGRIWMVVLEEKELAFWRAQISERRAVLRDILVPMISIQVHDVREQLGEQLGRVGSQVQYLGSRVDNVEAQVRNVGDEVGTLGVLVNAFLSTEVSRMGSEIRQVGTDVQTVQQAIHKILPHDISDPAFFVMDPLGKPIRIQLSRCNSFNDLDRLLRAYLYNRPDAGSRYVERGDYSIVSTDGVIIPPLKLPGKFRAGIQFDMSIIKRQSSWTTPRWCPHCGQTNTDAIEDTWVFCSKLTCGARYQVSESEGIEEISSPQISRQNRAEPSRQEDRVELFRLVQIFYEWPYPERWPPTPPRSPLPTAWGQPRFEQKSDSEDDMDNAIQGGPQIYEVSNQQDSHSEQAPMGEDDN